MTTCSAIRDVDAFNRTQNVYVAQDPTHVVTKEYSSSVAFNSTDFQKYLTDHAELCANPAVRYQTTEVASFEMPKRALDDASALAVIDGEKQEGGIPTAWGEPVILGALDKSLIDAVVKREMANLQRVYLERVKEVPTLGGKVTVKFVIDKDGSVKTAEIKYVSSGLDDEKFKADVLATFMGFQFPEPKGRGIVIVSYPFTFSPWS